MKSWLDIVKGCGGEGAGAPGGANPRAKDPWDPTVGQVKRVAEKKGLWQDVEFVPKIVEKIGG